MAIDWNVLGKYGTGAVVLGSVFYLVFTGKVDAQVYIGMTTGVLAGVGITTLPSRALPPAASQPESTKVTP